MLRKSSQKIISSLSIIALCLTSSSSFAQIFTIPPNGDNVVGHVIEVHAHPDETLSDIGHRFDVGFYEMAEANPSLNTEQSLMSYTRVVVPSRYILPPGPREGIVINLAELRLYYYLPNGHEVLTAPVGIGREGWGTPLGETKITAKEKDPYWHPTEHVRNDAADQGYILPEVWPPGPDNPLGKHLMRLGWPTYLIHGTHRLDGVGKRSSAGCIRMYPEDIEALFNMVPIGTVVRVVNNPIKVGWQNGVLYMEAHKPLQDKGKFVASDTMNIVERIQEITKDHPVIVKWREAYHEVQLQSGIPTVIGVEDSTG